MAATRLLYQRILTLQEAVRDHAQKELDRVLPGEKPAEHFSRNGYDLYRPVYRPATPVPGAPPTPSKEAHAAMVEEFTSKGGSLKDIHWLGPRFIDNLTSGQLAEWVQLGEKSVRITTSGAKHPVIGGGHAGRGAGSLKVYKNSRGEEILTVGSFSSGNYKPGVGATEGLTQNLVRAGIPEDHILVTSIIPEEPELVKLLLKSKLTYSKEQINDHVRDLKARTQPTPIVFNAPRPAAPVPAPARAGIAR
jgi:hypothetical protein